MKAIIYLVVAALIPQIAMARGQNGGGGDPRAAQAVVAYAKRFVGKLLDYRNLQIDIDPQKMLKTIDAVSASLDTKSPQLEFLPVTTVKCFNVPKEGCLHDNGVIDIAGLYWDNDQTTDNDRCFIAATEFVRKSQKITEIYEKVQAVCDELFPKNPDELVGRPDSLQKQIEQDQDWVNNFLQKKGHVILHEDNFQLSGEVHGQIKGHYEAKSPVASMLLGALLGGLTVPAVGAISDIARDVPFVLDGTMLRNTGLASGVGGAVGSLFSRKTGEGDISGSLDGHVNGRGWENLDDAHVFALTVLDPSQLDSGAKSPLQPYLNTCTREYFDALYALRGSHRYATPEEASELFTTIERIKQNIDKLRTSRFGMDQSAQHLILSQVEKYNSWLNKRITILYLGAYPLIINLNQSTMVTIHGWKVGQDNVSESEPDIKVSLPYFYSRDDVIDYINYYQKKGTFDGGKLYRGDELRISQSAPYDIYPVDRLLGVNVPAFGQAHRIDFTKINVAQIEIPKIDSTGAILSRPSTNPASGAPFVLGTIQSVTTCRGSTADFMNASSISLDMLFSDMDDSMPALGQGVPKNIPNYFNGSPMPGNY